MATINFLMYSKDTEKSAPTGKLKPIYVRVSAGVGNDFSEKTGKLIDPAYWKNSKGKKKSGIKPVFYNNDNQGQILEKEHQAIKDYLRELESIIEREINKRSGNFSDNWLTEIIDKHQSKRAENAENLNDYISKYIKDAAAGNRKGKGAMNITKGTIKSWKVFQRNFNEYQGVYTEKRRTWRKENEKPIRPVKLIDFEDINIDFYNSFVGYLTDEGFGRGTIGRHVKELKMFMKKSLEDGLHGNRQFEYSAFKIITNESFAIYLTKSEIDRIYNLDLSADPDLDISRDAFLTLCETALRVSDYGKVDLNIRKDESGAKFIHITQTKTGNRVVIPLSARMESILDKYNGTLPKTYDQLINRNIKIIAQRAKINDVLTWETQKYGKKFTKSKQKWELVCCHTGRRSAATNMYLAGIPPISIMQITGHKTEKMFLAYIKVTKEENAKILSAHPYFSGLKVV